MNTTVTPEVTTPRAELPVVRPRSALHEDADAYRVVVDLPGVAREDVSVRYEDHSLTVEGTTRPTPLEGLRRAEFGPRTFRASFRVGEGVDAEGIRASVELGRLTVTLPRRAEAVARTVPIEG